MITLLMSVFGGLLRMAPEILKFLDKKDERAHEITMFDRQLEADAARSGMRIDEIQAQGQVTLDAAGLSALTEAIKAQGKMTGVKWIDGWNQLMRPLLTTWWAIVLYTVVLVAQFILLTGQSGMSSVDAILALWGPEEKGTVSGMINFWFLDRVIRKQQVQ